MATIHEVRRAFCLSRAQLFGVRDGVTAAIEARLAGRESSLALLPSFLRRPAGLPSGTYLALDFGGSNGAFLCAGEVANVVAMPDFGGVVRATDGTDQFL